MQQIDNFCRKLHTLTKKKVYRKRKHGGSTLNESQVNERNVGTETVAKVNHTQG